MFRKIAALTLALPFYVSAFTLSTPKNLSSGGSATITWTTTAGDPGTFTLELSNTIFHNSYAIANNVLSSSGTISLELPTVPPGDGYTLIAVNIGNIGDVYATSGSFTVAPQGSETVTSTSSAASSGSSGSTKSVSTPAYTIPGTSSAFGVTVTAPASTSTPFGTIVSGSSTAPAASGSSTASGSSSGSAASPSISSSFNAGSSLHFGLNTGSVAVVLLSAVAGMAMAL